MSGGVKGSFPLSLPSQIRSLHWQQMIRARVVSCCMYVLHQLTEGKWKLNSLSSNMQQHRIMLLSVFFSFFKRFLLFLTLKTFFLLDSSLAQWSWAPLKSILLSGRLFPGFWKNRKHSVGWTEQICRATVVSRSTHKHQQCSMNVFTTASLFGCE